MFGNKWAFVIFSSQGSYIHLKNDMHVDQTLDQQLTRRWRLGSLQTLLKMEHECQKANELKRKKGDKLRLTNYKLASPVLGH